MVRTPNFHYRGHAFDPWSGNPVHCVVWQNKNKKEKKYMDYYDRLESNHRNTSFKKKKNYIYLAVPGLSCGTGELQSPPRLTRIFQLRPVGSSPQGQKPGPLHWKCRALATGPPGNSPELLLWFAYIVSTYFLH